MRILGIETSCDETAAAVVEDGRVLLSNVVLSSMDLHTAYGGVVPEIAARSHIEAIMPVIDQALREAFVPNTENGERSSTLRDEPSLRDPEGSSEPRTAGSDSNERTKNGKKNVSDSRSPIPYPLFPIPLAQQATMWDQIDGIAVTYGAGLGGSLLIGILAARTLAIVKDKPLYAINHVEGHVYANFLTESMYDVERIPYSVKDKRPSIRNTLSAGSSHQTYILPKKQPEFPMLALIVSGGHSQLVFFRDHFDYDLLGQTQDDAIGEAFDKVAKILGLPYPGGPSIGKKAQEGNPFALNLPKAKMPGRYDFSFSGLKTAVLRLAQQQIGEDYQFPSSKLSERLSEAQKADIAASFQRIAIETVVDKTLMAYKEFLPASVVIAGGVAASPELRRQLSERLPCPISYTDPKLCTDNGAMIAALGCFKMMHSQQTADPYTLDIEPNLSM